MTRAALCAAALALVSLGGCSDAVDPTLGTDQAFSLYGYLDPTADRQAVRVVPIVRAIEADTARVINVAVASVEQETGRTATWRDSVVTYADGSVGHVFVADYTPTAEATVVLRVTEQGGDNREAVVEVAVPSIDRPEVGTARVDAAAVVYPVRIAAPRVIGARLVYHVVGMPEAPADTVAVPFDDVAPLHEVGPGAWALDLDFLPTSRAFLASPEVAGARLALVAVDIEAVVANDAWAMPPGGFDVDAIIEPGTFSNVAGGFGFVGAGYRAARSWVPSLATQSRAGFVVTEDPASLLFLNEASAEGWVELYNPTLEAIAVGGYTLATDLGEAAVPTGLVVTPHAFVVLEAVLAPGPRRVELRAPDRATALQLEVPSLPEPDFGSFGSFPDGRSRQIGEFGEFRDFDLFRGRTAPTPGAPNRIVGAFPVLNEVLTAGPDGWAELWVPLRVEDLRVASDAATPFGRWARAGGASPFRLADEAAGRLELGQGGGEVLVAVQVNATSPPRVVDVRAYGPQAPQASSGLLPDGDVRTWRTGLRPTRGAPNAAARPGL